MSEEITDESQILFDLIQERYGDRLGPRELEEVRLSVEAGLETAKTMRAVRLENGDEPFSVFTPYRKEG